MGLNVMGKVEVACRLENEYDLMQARHGQIDPSTVRSIDVADALVDTGATMLGVPLRLIQALGLVQMRQKSARTTNGVITRWIYGGARLTIQGRDVLCEVSELPDDCPVLIGQIPLEGLDFVVDPIGRQLIGNPAHGGVAMLEEYTHETITDR